MRKNLLLHKAKNVPKDKHGYEFNKWCVELINEAYVKDDGTHALRRKLVPEDIDRAHILRTKRRDANVILVQFMNMTLRNEVFFAKTVLKTNDTFSISEHLTPDNIQLLNTAKENAGKAWSADCKIFIEKDGRKQLIRSSADLDNAKKRYANNHGNSRRGGHKKYGEQSSGYNNDSGNRV